MVSEACLAADVRLMVMVFALRTCVLFLASMGLMVSGLSNRGWRGVEFAQLRHLVIATITLPNCGAKEMETAFMRRSKESPQHGLLLCKAGFVKLS